MREAGLILYSVVLISLFSALGIVLNEFDKVQTELTVISQDLQETNKELEKLRKDLEFTNAIVDQVIMGKWE